jgi:hypothetical protein
MIRSWLKNFFKYDYVDSESIYLVDESIDRKYNLADVIFNMSARIDELEEQVIDLEMRVDNITRGEYNLKSFSLGE